MSAAETLIPRGDVDRNHTPMVDATSQVHANLPGVTSTGGNPLFSALQGRTTTFLAFFTLMGTIMHWFHRLDPTYMSFIGIIMGFVLAHSVKDDNHEQAMAVLPKPAPVLPES